MLGGMSRQPHNPEPVFLGIECGGTRTVALLVRGAEFWRMEAGGANLCLISDAQMLRLFRQVNAWRLSLTPTLDALAIGMAGARTPVEKQRILDGARQIWPEWPIQTASDLETGLAAAGPWPPPAPRNQAHRPNRRNTPAARVLVLSGTGSCCFGSDTLGNSCRVGGWGHQLGDRGSAYDIGLRALQQVVQEYDHTDRWPALGQRLLGILLLNDPEHLVAWMQQADKAAVAALAVEVFAAAAGGDRLARAVIQQAAERMAADAAQCAARLVRRGQRVEYVLAGSVPLKQPGFSAWIRRGLRKAWPNGRVSLLPRESAWGAVELAQARFGALGVHALACPSPPSTLKRELQTGPERQQERGGAAPQAPISQWDLDLGQNSPTEQRNPRSRHLDKLSLGDAIELMIREDATLPAAIRQEKAHLEQAVKLIVRAFRQGGRLFYVGAGTSGRLGVLDASECPPTFRTKPELVQGIIAGGPAALWQSLESTEDDAGAGAEALQARGVQAHDVVVGIAASGRTPFVWGALHEAAHRHAKTVLLCCNPRLVLPAGPRPQVVVALNTGPEVLTGSTRLKAGTATKLVLNMLTTLSMVRLGKVVENFMVDMNPANAKLRERAVRIVQALTQADDPAAREALAKSQWVITEALARLRPKRRGGTRAS